MAASSHKLVPSDPEKTMVIRHLTPDVVTMSTPFFRFGRIKIGGRGTLVRLESGAVAVFSPVALTDAVKKETEALGRLEYIVAPDQEHHIFLESWHKAYPQAQVIGPETLPELRDKQNYFKIPSFTLFKQDQKATVSPEFDQEFDYEYVHGHANKELVFNHRKSRTLIEADLLFNLPANEQFSKSGTTATSGILTKIMNSLQSTQGSAIWQKRLLWYGIAQDKNSFNASMIKIAGWDFDRIVPCHGDVIESGGKGVFEKVMGWHLAAAKKSG